MYLFSIRNCLEYIHFNKGLFLRCHGKTSFMPQQDEGLNCQSVIGLCYGNLPSPHLLGWRHIFPSGNFILINDAVRCKKGSQKGLTATDGQIPIEINYHSLSYESC